MCAIDEKLKSVNSNRVQVMLLHGHLPQARHSFDPILPLSSCNHILPIPKYLKIHFQMSHGGPQHKKVNSSTTKKSIKKIINKLKVKVQP